jgi:hypothetical protein
MTALRWRSLISLPCKWLIVRAARESRVKTSYAVPTPADEPITVIRSSKEFLVEKPLGRVALHALCLCRGGRIRWHLSGIAREIRKMFRP